MKKALLFVPILLLADGCSGCLLTPYPPQPKVSVSIDPAVDPHADPRIPPDASAKVEPTVSPIVEPTVEPTEIVGSPSPSPGVTDCTFGHGNYFKKICRDMRNRK